MNAITIVFLIAGLCAAGGLVTRPIRRHATRAVEVLAVMWAIGRRYDGKHREKT